MDDIYQLTGEYLKIQEAAEKNDPHMIDALRSQIEDAITDCCPQLSNLSSEEKMIDEEVKRLNARKKAAKNEQFKIRESMMLVLDALEIDKISNPFYTISVKKSSTPSLVIDDEDSIPERFLIPQKPAIDNDGIKKYLKELKAESDEDAYDDENCNFAHLEYKRTLMIK